VGPLCITTDIDARGVAGLGVAGELVVDTADDFIAAVTAAVGNERVTRVVADLARVVFLDTDGLSALLQGRAIALHAGVSFRIIRPQGLVRRVLHRTGTCLLLTVEPARAGHQPWALAAGR
jgi:anti-anti-sigma factor